MICHLCNKEIESHQLRHSDGLGDYHIACEFNEIRRRLGMPDFISVRRVKYYSPVFQDIGFKQQRPQPIDRVGVGELPPSGLIQTRRKIPA